MSERDDTTNSIKVSEPYQFDENRVMIDLSHIQEKRQTMFPPEVQIQIDAIPELIRLLKAALGNEDRAFTSGWTAREIIDREG